ncbi:cytochrome c biogenesis protein CcsA [Spongiivirga citrea]|uniref:Cytochrome C biogenesis protein n=1 Tax=Spongiivirga citrea TaxID=1481457 RepID=A0A6M0CIX8_9FLAO|nr:cytochrome c biogenesis protein CcsA [Spongiivirga citrea]NER16933.1 cytochrome C biogenesis protein [Spongiivirga citrea]
MKKISKLLFSPSWAVFLLIAFAVSMAVATFIENDFGTATARVLVYNAWWFELIMVLLAICFAGNIYKYRLWRKEKWGILLFHLAFIVIILGAGITRYTAYEGVMRIREGETSNTVISDRNFIQVHVKDDTNPTHIRKEFYYSALKDNDFTINVEHNNIPISISHSRFIADATPEIIDNKEGGEAILQLVISTGNGRETVFLKKGEIEEIGQHRHKIAFGVDDKEAIQLQNIDGELKIKSPHDIDYYIMAKQAGGKIEKDSLQPLELRTLYRAGDFSFVPLSYHENATIDFVSSAEKPRDNDELKEDAVVLNLSVGETTKEVSLFYREGHLPIWQDVEIKGAQMSFAYGSIPITIPFSIKLYDFQLERYPGSTSPSSYASEVAVVENNQEEPYRIFMNNVLDHGGYRFFQASYDTDELGTVLSVNHDQWGTYVSYLGYFLMGLGMFWTLFGKGSRFVEINKKLKKLKPKPALTTLLVVASFSLTSANTYNDSLVVKIKEQISAQEIEASHASLFGRLMVQDLDGRIKPINTLASEFLRKVSRKPYYKFEVGNQQVRFTADQAFLAMHADPKAWQRIPIIKIDKKKGGDILAPLISTDQDLVSFNALLNAEGKYILAESVEAANAKKPANRNEFDKEMLNIDERFNILFNVFSGNYLKIFPRKDDENNTWYSYTHDFSNFSRENADFVQSIIPNYFNALNTKNYAKANEDLSYIKTYQDVLGKEIIPNDNRVAAELWYNEMNLNFWLFQLFFTLGFILLALSIIRIFTNNKLTNILWNTLVILSLISLLVFTGNIILRWYVAQHAPWSNGYEMLVFVAWVLMLCGILTYRKSDFSLPLATLFTGTLLFVSYLDWINPEITNLMPVLKSYWLKVHVATIVSSYAPLALSAILGLMALLLMIFKTKKHAATITVKIKELTYINEIAMTIGLFVLAVGTFLGGIWANESWGRYWAWDPKETWALISIIIYAAVLHLRFIPGLRSRYALNTASVFAFGSIIMTSFGVNYYLSGLHSYAAGDPLPIPKFIYVLVILVVLVSVVAYFRVRQAPSRVK